MNLIRLKRDAVELAPYTPQWDLLFRAEAQLLQGLSAILPVRSSILGVRRLKEWLRNRSLISSLASEM